MDSQKFQIILDGLLERSEKNQLVWKKTAGTDKYLVTLKESSIAIQNFGGIIFIEFRNEKGEVVEKIMNNESDEKLDRLFDLAKRKALNSDETIDRIIEQLKPDSIALS